MRFHMVVEEDGRKVDLCSFTSMEQAERAIEKAKAEDRLFYDYALQDYCRRLKDFVLDRDGGDGEFIDRLPTPPKRPRFTYRIEECKDDLCPFCE